MNRHNCNLAIIDILTKYINRNPELRFHQILWNLGIIESERDGNILDKFYEESVTTLDKLRKNSLLSN